MWKGYYRGSICPDHNLLSGTQLILLLYINQVAGAYMLNPQWTAIYKIRHKGIHMNVGLLTYKLNPTNWASYLSKSSYILESGTPGKKNIFLRNQYSCQLKTPHFTKPSKGPNQWHADRCHRILPTNDSWPCIFFTRCVVSHAPSFETMGSSYRTTHLSQGIYRCVLWRLH